MLVKFFKAKKRW